MPYPTRDEAYALFEHLGRGENEKFFARVKPDVDWTVMGTSPMSKQYMSLQDFQTATLQRLAKILKEPPGLKLQIRFLVMGTGGKGDQAEDGWVTAELHANAECIDGSLYRMVYCWVCKFDQGGMIETVRAYLDTRALAESIIRNECPSGKGDPHF